MTMTCPSTQSWNLHPGRHSAPLYGSQPPHPAAAPIGAVPEPSTPYPQPRAVTWCRSTCCYCGCAGASPRAVCGERRAGVRLQGEAPSLHPTGLRGLTLEVLARSCCSSRGDVTVGMRHSGDRFSRFCWRRSGRCLTAPQKVTRAPTSKPSKAAYCLLGKIPTLCSTRLCRTRPLLSALASTTLPRLLGFSPTHRPFLAPTQPFAVPAARNGLHCCVLCWPLHAIQITQNRTPQRVLARHLQLSDSNSLFYLLYTLAAHSSRH